MLPLNPESEPAPEVTVTDATTPYRTPAAPDPLAALRAQHPRLIVLDAEVGDGLVLAARPLTRREYERFRARIMDEKKRPEAVEEVARMCLVHPDRVAFNGLLEDYPALVDGIGSKVLEAAGADKVSFRK